MTEPDAPTAIVRSEVEPEAKLLLVARSIIQHDEELRAIFAQAREQQRPLSWLRDMVAARIAAELISRIGEVEFSDVLDLCQYLADEHHQLGEGFFLVSTETGRVELVVDESDLHSPGLLPRDSGNLAPGLLRLDPQRELAFTLHHAEREREERVLTALTARAHQTPLQKQEGDSRLRIATRVGRSAMAKELAENDPRLLISRAGGMASAFLQHFRLVGLDEDVDQPELCINTVAVARSVLGIQDLTTVNLAYDRLGVLRATAPQGWVRDMARELSSHLQNENRSRMPMEPADVTEAIVRRNDLWVVDPNLYGVFRCGRVFPVDQAEPFGLKGPAGCIAVDHQFRVESREVMGRWEVTVSLVYKLYLDPRAVEYLPIIGMSYEAEVDDAEHYV